MSDAKPEEVHPFRVVPYMGVIYVVAEAMKLGFYNGHPDWSNLGQGQPEIGPLEGAPPRIDSVQLQPEDHAYGHIGGIDELKEAVAAHYNRLYRVGKASQYTADNVSIAQGGRLSLSRALAALGPCNIGFQLPDYTAYQDMFDIHLGHLTPIPIRALEAEGFRIPPQQAEREITERGLSAFLVSNPCNPTGNLLDGEELADLVRIGSEHRCLMLLDEFYSHFIYTADGKPGRQGVSAAEFIEDVNRDPVILFDGLTKCYRYPGWRIGWTLGPKHLIETIDRVASSMDGGPSRVTQRAALQVLEPARADQETAAVRKMFAAKRNTMLQSLKELGVTFAHESRSTFYLWGSLANLPEPWNDAKTFFRQALQRKVMTVPGEFFDINPGKRRVNPSPYKSWMRFSFGPPMDNMQQGLSRLHEMLQESAIRS